MVAVLEKVKIVTKEGFIHVCNHIGEKWIDYINDNEFNFEKGRIYGLVGEHGSGGEIISSLLSGRIKQEKNSVYIDNNRANEAEVQKNGWYVGKAEYTKGLIKKEISVRRAIQRAIKEYHRYENINEVVEEFHLTPERLGYGLSKYSGERLRASLAIGYISNKEIYCFPWMNTAFFRDIILSSGVFRFFKKMRDEGCIIILPTSRVENVVGLVDEVIEMETLEFKNVISQNSYFIEHF